jgi:S1-C subfamily serine protease
MQEEILSKGAEEMQMSMSWKGFSFLLVSGVSLIVSGCTGRALEVKPTPQSTPEIRVSTPVAVKDAPEFSVAKIKSSILPGAVVGYHYEGVFQVRQGTWYAKVFSSESMLDHLKSAITDELQSAGYKVAGQPGGIFEEDTGWKARYLIGGMITGGRVNTYGLAAGNSSECNIKVSWEIYDKQKRESILKKETSGAAKFSGVDQEVIASALRNSIRQMLASDEFVALVKKLSEIPTLAGQSQPVAFLRKDKTKGKLTFDEMNRAIIAVKTEKGHGSGFIINPEGYAITSYHTIADRNKIDVLLKGGKPMLADVVAIAADKDLALIKLKGEEYDWLPLGDSNEVKIGMDVYAVGAPISLDLSHSLSKGIVSGRRTVKELGVELIQTDAPVNPGNSGGPLINSEGEVLGIIALKIAAPGIEGLGFAISINDCKKYLNLQPKESK